MPKIGLLLHCSKSSPKKTTGPIGENVPNLVTLPVDDINRFTNKDNKCSVLTGW
jgi:hypothetical protein